MKAYNKYLTEVESQKLATVNTKFGKIYINIEKQIYFPNGILGFSNFTKFCLANFPKEQFNKFKILHSLQNHELNLLVYPLVDYNNFQTIYESKDFELINDKFSIKAENIIYFGVVNLNKNINDNLELTANLRAPIIIDYINLRGFQHVLHNNKYLMKFKLNV